MTPVVGIVLLVALTLLLAATVAAFALGIEDEQGSDRLPTVAVNFEYDRAAGDDALTVVHKSGQAVDSSRIDVVVRGADCDGGPDDPNGRYGATNWVGGHLTAGDSVEVDGTTAVTCSSGTLDLRGATVQVVWNPASGRSTLVRSWHGPG
jgi:FlaG/FlaF family flagellin (archaellin)